VPRPLLVWALAVVGMVAATGLPPSRVGLTLLAALSLAATVLVWRWSHRGDWSQQHVLALASGAVIAAGGYAFLTTPIGEVSDAEKYGHNIALLLLVVGLSAWAARRARAGWT
jgi:uncharacterized membrane protein YfcA